jgi:hypothetical protein
MEAPSRLFLRSRAALAPLAWELPPALTDHAATLRKLGLRCDSIIYVPEL